MDRSAQQAHLKLLLHRAAPAYEVAWMAGYEAAQIERAETENPFVKGDTEYTAWEAGWWAGFYGEEPLYAEAKAVSAPLTAAQPKSAKEPPLHREATTVITFSSPTRFLSKETTKLMCLFAFVVSCVAFYAWLAAE